MEEYNKPDFKAGRRDPAGTAIDFVSDFFSSSLEGDPTSSSEADFWRKAINHEMDSLLSIQTLETSYLLVVNTLDAYELLELTKIG